jgi:hypothetical protein
MKPRSILQTGGQQFSELNVHRPASCQEVVDLKEFEPKIQSLLDDFAKCDRSVER